MNIDAIIVNYNAGQPLRDAVESLLRCAQVRRVIVVDNASSDGSLSLVAGLPRVRVVRHDRNVGFAKGCNSALGLTTSEFLLFLNPDCLVETGAIESMLACLVSSPRAAMAGPRLLNTDRSEQIGGRRAIPTPRRAFARAFGFSRLPRRYARLFPDFALHTQPLPERPVEVEAISGACMLVRRTALDEVGPLDEGYFMHCEDLDWCMRFGLNGWKIMFVPDAVVIHHKGISSRSRPIFVEWHKHRGMMRFYRKFFSHGYPRVLTVLVALGVWTRFVAVSARHVLRLPRRRPRVEGG